LTGGEPALNKTCKGLLLERDRPGYGI
jgi:hypothetical protein